MNRRSLIKALGIAGVTVSSENLFSADSQMTGFENHRNEAIRENSIPVWQASTTETATTLVVVGKTDEELKFLVSQEGSNQPPRFKLEKFQPFADQEKIYHLHFDQLQLGSTYQISIRTESGDMKTTRRFRSLSSKANRFTTVSCSNFILSSDDIWKKLAEQKPDFLIYMGDCVYADRATSSLFKKPSSPESATERYIKTTRSLELYHQKNLIPILNIWDDHDYGWNNGDARHPHKKFMQSLFRLFFPQKLGFDLATGPGVSFAETINGTRFVFIDNRSFRNYESAGNQMFGADQRNWIISQLMKAKGPVILVSGSQFFGFEDSSDSLTDSHFPDYQWLMNLLRSVSVPVIFMAGDVHYSRLEKIPDQVLGYDTYEITSSAVHSISAANSKKRNVPSELGYYGYNNFNLIEIKSAFKQQLKFKVSCISEDETEYQFDLDVTR